MQVVFCVTAIWGCLLIAPAAVGQQFTISGTVTDSETGEVLIGATVYAVTLDKGATTNRYGFYSLTLRQRDSLSVMFSYLGFEPQVKKILPAGDLLLNIQLDSQTAEYDEVIVEADRLSPDNIRAVQAGVIDVPVRMIQTLPAILGEQDVLKIIQLLPGVQSGNEGTTGIYVRGGNIDQNLVRLDDAVVYNPNHLFGLFSTFNTNALNDVRFVKGGFPASYGGRLSSVVEISMREGNQKRFGGQAGIGLITSQGTFEGPIVKDKGSFIISGRRSYLDLVSRPFVGSNRQNTYHFYDVNGKANYRLGKDDRMYVSVFRGRDIAKYVDASGLGYNINFGNTTTTYRWNHIFGSKLFGNLSLIRNNYFLEIATVQAQFFSQNFSGIRDLTAKADFEFYPTPTHKVDFGFVAMDHRFRSTGFEGEVVKDLVIPAFDNSNIIPKSSNEYALYVNDTIDLTSRLGISAGVRVPHYTTVDTSYTRVEPRLTLKVEPDAVSSVKASYTVMNQFVHSVPSTTASLPTDIWIPSSRITQPQHSEQVSLGYFREINEGSFETSLEVYYKWMRNQVLFKQGTQLLGYADIDQELTFGKGWSYGAELFARKSRGRVSGWLSYTLSWTNQKFAGLNFGRTFPFRYDRRHNLSTSGVYELNDRWTLSSTFVFTSGVAFTLPTGRVFSAEGGNLYSGLFYDYERLNNYRLRPYHRLDISATYHFKPERFKESKMVIGFYNIYNRLNPYYVFLDVDINNNQPIGKQVSLFPILPSISYSFKF
ncbi:MAG: TonB-dependent receptor [Rhodothermales bacterium]|nr:TonB-dependent receptor [Rhodothermales bacterium]